MEEKQEEILTPGQGDALLIVDVQEDFLPGGSLAVPHGNEIIVPLNRYIRIFRQRHLPIVATRDWHPRRHCSFQSQGGPWPMHCVQESEGARISAVLELPEDVILVSKGTREDKDAYSGFQDTGLKRLLREQGIARLFIGGLATDYCVLNTVLDALELGFSVCLLTDAIRAVDVQPGDGDKALAQMFQAGARGITLESLS
ncbi:MAG TPA: nicotinamidase [Gammaproteobacteria bacterium]|nr:nicotinamidase [Gammaproteobacteria bacterium]